MCGWTPLYLATGTLIFAYLFYLVKTIRLLVSLVLLLLLLTTRLIERRYPLGPSCSGPTNLWSFRCTHLDDGHGSVSSSLAKQIHITTRTPVQARNQLLIHSPPLMPSYDIFPLWSF
ncbi:hypothetical protein BDV98DRAFT_264312 [Pterulicium gracile]|uniref:Uncharacterized protein n=1 Tax=Pterulicium gracile TaxID=1884261 RepID=A0A5C3Q8K0_9AGAR|nr:hypothetical protein BDV98DRAFT_264312 [Pterula gracilis]